MPLPLLPLGLSFTPNLITVILDPYYKLPESQLSGLEHIQNSLTCRLLSLKLVSPVSSLLSYALSTWLRITERIEYKLLSLTHKVLSTKGTTQPPYFHNLISV